MEIKQHIDQEPSSVDERLPLDKIIDQLEVILGQWLDDSNKVAEWAPEVIQDMEDKYISMLLQTDIPEDTKNRVEQLMRLFLQFGHNDILKQTVRTKFFPHHDINDLFLPKPDETS